MHVALLGYLLHGGPDYRSAGVSRYVRELLRHLPHASPDCRFSALVGADAVPCAGTNAVVASLPTWRAPGRILQEQLVVSRFLSTVDVVHGTVNVLPLAPKTPGVVTVHDLAFLRMPERFRAARAGYLRIAVRASVRRARHIIAVSEHTRADAMELLDVEPDRVTVIPSGVDAAFHPRRAVDVDVFRQERLGRPFILYVGTLEPRKNVPLLLRAFAQVRRRLAVPHTLVLAGARGWMYGEVFRSLVELGLQDHVRVLDHVPEAELPLWYNSADLFVYPSAYEGFGLPVLEAMASGTPTITTASSALGELARDACMTVEPGSQEALELALARMLADASLRSSLAARGLERAASFTWERCARETASVYLRVMGKA